ncbi:MAG: hypothetical protein ABR950_00890 [Candidatus Dormibacteria bacterium]|jgi:hypothetical protein
MRRFGRLGSAALAGTALLLIAACAQSLPAPTAPSAQSVAPISSPVGATSASSSLAATPSAAAPSAAGTSAAGSGSGATSDQLGQIDDQLNQIDNQIDNQIGQVNQGLATSEGDPAQ